MHAFGYSFPMRGLPANLERWCTRRLRLSRPVLGDLDDLCRMEQDPRTMALLLGVRTPDQTRAGLDRMIAHWEAHGFGWWIARDPVGGGFLGRGGLRRVDIGGQAEVELGYGFHADHWGLGLATELARESVRLALQDLGLESVVSFTLPGNLASRRVMEKAGLSWEGEIEWASHPHVLYRIRALPGGA